MIEFISVMFRAITGMKLTPDTLIVLGFFFILGWLFGKLTRRIGIIKGILLVVFGVAVFAFLSVAPGVIVTVFLAGVLTNHGPLLARLIYWAYDISDIYYGLKYRQAFADIRAEEERMEEEIRRARAEAYANAHAGGDSATQDRWRRTSGRSTEQEGRTSGASSEHGSRSSAGAASPEGEKEKTKTGSRSSKEPPRGSSTSSGTTASSRDPVRDRHLKVLGLKSGDYSKADIKKAFRTRAKETHPDAGGNSEEFMAVKAAWEALSSKV